MPAMRCLLRMTVRCRILSAHQPRPLPVTGRQRPFGIVIVGGPKEAILLLDKRRASQRTQDSPSPLHHGTALLARQAPHGLAKVDGVVTRVD